MLGLSPAERAVTAETGLPSDGSIRVGRRRARVNLETWIVLLVSALLAACDPPRSDPTSPPQPLAPRGDLAASRAELPKGADSAAPRAAAPAAAARPALEPSGAGTAQSRRGMVVSVEAQATRAGVEILQAGGNAIDAAVATAYALAVTHPSAGNIGGGGFMLIARPGEPVVALDFRERAPLALSSERFDALIAKGPFGPAASAVPGSVAGLNAAQRRFGRLGLAAVMAPALRLARAGHVVGPREALTIGWNWARLARDPEAARSFGAKGRPLRAGAKLVRADLARTLERIASEGDAGFYAGPTARAIAGAMRNEGLIRLADLQAYRAVERTALVFPYRGYEVATMPPPSSGGVAVRQMLLALDRLGAHALAAESAAELHLLLEVAKRAQALRRTELVDPDAAPDAMAPERLLARFSPERLLQDSPAIDLARATAARAISPLYDTLAQEPDQTTHFAVLDADGNAVSCTTTLSSGFGAGYVVPGTGIVMNNSLPAFSRAGLNLPAAGRRMLSSMSPTILSMDGRPVAMLGSPGGDTIPSSLVQIIRRLLDHRLSIDLAVEAPRIHHGFVPDVVRYEKQRPWPAEVLAELARLGHALEAKGAPIGDAKNILVVDGVAYGHADTREGGLAAGPESGTAPQAL